MIATDKQTSPIFHDFDAEMAEVSGEPVQFKLGGFVFTCVNPIPIGLFVVLAHKLQSATQEAQATATLNALWSCIVPEQHDLFDEAVSGLSDPGVLEKIMEYIGSSATGRPIPGA